MEDGMVPLALGVDEEPEIKKLDESEVPMTSKAENKSVNKGVIGGIFAAGALVAGKLGFGSKNRRFAAAKDRKDDSDDDNNM